MPNIMKIQQIYFPNSDGNYYYYNNVAFDSFRIFNPETIASFYYGDTNYYSNHIKSEEITSIDKWRSTSVVSHIFEKVMAEEYFTYA